MRLKSQPENKNNWLALSTVFMPVNMAFDLLFLMMAYQKYFLGYFFYELEIPGIIPEVGKPLSFAVRYVGPPLLLNYVLVLRNNRYERLMQKYEYHEGKLFVAYMAIALFVPLVSLLLAMYFGKI